MVARVRHDLPEGDIRIVDETEAVFTLAIKIPKSLIGRNRPLLDALLDAVAVDGGDEGGPP
jgi:hypothetical protein